MLNIDRGHDIISMIERQAILSPNAIACKCNMEVISYKSLVHYVNEYAKILQSNGVKRGEIVIICVSRSIKMLIQLLAILKINAVYLPLDINLPEERIKFIISDAKAKWIVADDKIKKVIIKLSIKNINERKTDCTFLDIYYKCHINDLAYIIYTSGSTGRPKGVMIKRSSLNNFLISMKHRLTIKKNDVFLALTTISFDIAALELYLPLICGAKCIIENKYVVLSASYFEDIIKREKISFIQATPTFWELMIDMGWRGHSNLTILSGGEKITSRLVVNLIDKCNELWNMYGPTETTIWSSMKKIKNIDEIDLGEPIDNTVLCVVDIETDMVIKEGVGELLIGGEGLALGYLNQGELTSSKFILGKKYIDNCKILYRTGDLVKKYKNGRIVYINRIDEQIKYKGHRIELGEIEERINSINGINKGIVELINYGNNNELVAFLKLNVDANISKNSIIKSLKCFLPDYMIPTMFYIIEEVPIMINGKINRNMIKNKEYIETLTMLPYESKKNLIHSEDNNILRLIRKVLNNNSILLEDKLLHIGLDSYKMVILSVEMNNLGYNISVKDLLNCSNVVDIVNCVSILNKKLRGNENMKFIKSGSVLKKFIIDDELFRQVKERYGNNIQVQKVYPLTYCQTRMLYNNIFYKETSTFNQYIYFKVCGLLNLNICKKALSWLTEEYEILRSIYTLKGLRTPMRIVLNSYKHKIEVLDNTYNIKKILDSEKKRIYNINLNVPFKLTIVMISKMVYQFIWSYHHIMLDGLSINKLIEKFFEKYIIICGREKKSTTNILNKDNDNVYAEWLMKKELYTEKAFWDKYLENYDYLIFKKLINNKERKKFEIKYDKRVIEESISIESIVINRYEKFINEKDISLNIAITFIWALVLAYKLKITDVIFGMVFSGRNSCPSKYINNIDMMINSVPVRLKINMNDTFINNLINIKKIIHLIMKYEYMPIEQIKIDNINPNLLLDNLLVFDDYKSHIKQIKGVLAHEFSFVMNDYNSYEFLDCELGILVSKDEDMIIRGIANELSYSSKDLKEIVELFDKIIKISIDNEMITVNEIYESLILGVDINEP